MKLFYMNDCEWWRAPSLEEAIQLMMKECGMTREAVMADEPRELSETELDKLVFVDSNPDEEEPEAGWPERTFREELNQQDAFNLPAGIFAGTADCM